MTTNAAVLQDAYEAWLAYVTTHPDFEALNLKVWSAPTGTPIPIREDGTIGGTELPAFYVETIRPAWSEVANDNAGGQRLLLLRIEGGVAYGSRSIAEPNAVFDASAAQLTLIDIHGSGAARGGELAGTASIDDYEFEPGDVISVVAKDNPRVVRFWDAQFVVTLQKLVTFA